MGSRREGLREYIGRHVFSGEVDDIDQRVLYVLNEEVYVRHEVSYAFMVATVSCCHGYH